MNKLLRKLWVPLLLLAAIGLYFLFAIAKIVAIGLLIVAFIVAVVKFWGKIRSVVNWFSK